MASQSRAPSTDGVRRRRGVADENSGLYSPQASVSDGRDANGGFAVTGSSSRQPRPPTYLLDRIPPSTLRGAILLQALLIFLLAGAHVVTLLGGRGELPTFLSPLVEGGFFRPAASAVPSSPPAQVTTSVRPETELATARPSPPSPAPGQVPPPPPVDFAVTIYTYNRPRLLANLLGDIAREAAAADVTVAVNVLDDASLGCVFQPTGNNVFDTWDGFAEAEAATAGRLRPGAAAFPPGEGYAGDPYLHLVASGNASDANRELRRPCASSMRYARVVDAVRAQPTWRFFTARYRHGRRRYWHLVATAHRLLRPPSTRAARFYVFLPDDDRLAAGFFSKATAAWTSIPSSRKMTLLLHIEASREAVPVWTDVAPKPVEATGGAIVDIGWVESGNFMTTARFLDEFRWSFRRIDPSRWVRNPPISSGVGAELSTFLHRRRWRLYRTHGSLLAHVSPAVSQMNGPFRSGSADATHRTLRFADGEAAYDALLRGTPSVTASMASTYRREAALHAAVGSLLPQVDALNVYLNDYDAMPRFLVGVPGLTVVWAGDFGDGGGVGDLGDRGKFFWAANLTTDFHFTVDDDIVYPPDYVATLTAFADAHAQPVAVGAHGIKVIPEKLSPPGGRRGAGYYGSREVWMGVDEVSDAVGVHILGTGTLAYRVAAVGPLDAVADFPEPNMADVWFGVLAQRRRLPLVVAPHGGGWLREVGGTAVDSLYGRFTVRARADRLQTRAAKAALPWVVHPAALRGADG